MRITPVVNRRSQSHTDVGGSRLLGLAAIVFLWSARGAALPAFPGAEGFGSQTPGGRGGRVIAVTNLEDHGPGSFREACAEKGPRVIVFRVGGTIELESHLHIPEPYVTIAGQTAPGDGVLLRNAGLYVDTHDVVIRHLRVRIGPSRVEDYDSQDSLHIEGEAAHHIVVDHCSFSWSTDEVVGVSAGAHDVTLSWNIIAEPLEQPFGAAEIGEERKHAYAVMLGGYPDRVTLHHNLVAHAAHRNPRIQGGTHEFSNNLVYDWGYFAAVFSRFPNVNFIGNYYKAGPESRRIVPINDDVRSLGRIYARGNISPMRPSEAVPDEWRLVCAATEEISRATAPFAAAPLTYTSAVETYIDVLARAGCRVPTRDSVDRRILADVANGTGKIINRPEDVGGFPEIEAGEPPNDTDGDGMPDEWEQQHGLNPEGPKDGNLDEDGDGYTNVEQYLNEIASGSVR